MRTNRAAGAACQTPSALHAWSAIAAQPSEEQATPQPTRSSVARAGRETRREAEFLGAQARHFRGFQTSAIRRPKAARGMANGIADKAAWARHPDEFAKRSPTRNNCPPIYSGGERDHYRDPETLPSGKISDLDRCFTNRPFQRITQGKEERKKQRIGSEIPSPPTGEHRESWSERSLADTQRERRNETSGQAQPATSLFLGGGKHRGHFCCVTGESKWSASNTRTSRGNECAFRSHALRDPAVIPRRLFAGSGSADGQRAVLCAADLTTQKGQAERLDKLGVAMHGGGKALSMRHTRGSPRLTGSRHCRDTHKEATRAALGWWPQFEHKEDLRWRFLAQGHLRPRAPLR